MNNYVLQKERLVVSASKTLIIPGITDSATLACIARSRKYKQHCKAVEDALAGRCAFCNPDPKYNTAVEIPGLQFWRVQYCNPAEKYTKFHFLLIPLRHVKDSRQLSPEEQAEYWAAMNILPGMFDFTYRGILARDGDATMSSGTIQHLHFHIMVPDGTGRVESPFCKTPDEEAAGVVRAIIYEKIRTGTALESLPSEEQQLVHDRMS